MALDQTLKKRLALTTAMLSVIGGYSRRAYAQCTSGGVGTYACSGTSMATQNLVGNPLTVSTAGPFNLTTSSGDAFTLNGTGGVSFLDSSSATVINGAENGITATNATGGNLSITTTGAVTGTGVVGNGIAATNNAGASLAISTGAVTGRYAGIHAVNKGSGLLSITSTGVVTATAGNAVYARNYGAIGLTIHTSADVSGGTNGIVGKNDGAGPLDITTDAATTVTAPGNAVFGLALGAGDLTITTHGAVVGTTGAGIYAGNTATSGDILVTASSGASGALGVSVHNNSVAAQATINTRGGAVTGGTGIGVGNYAGTNMSIVTDAVTGTAGNGVTANNAGGTGYTYVRGFDTITSNTAIGIQAINGTSALGGMTIDAIDVHGATLGISATNQGAGATSITVHGDVTSSTGRGISVVTNNGAGVATAGSGVNVNTYGIVTGSAEAIRVTNNGTNASSTGITINARGAVTSQANIGISAISDTSAIGGITITATDVTGATTGISASNRNSGATSITTTGAVMGTSGPGIDAANTAAGSTSLTIQANAVSGGTYGIRALNSGTGAVSITTNGNVTSTGTGSNSTGIYARNSNGTGGVAIVTGAGTTVRGYNRGIYGLNFGAGALSITANGDVTSVHNNGISAYNSANGMDMMIVTAPGTTVMGGYIGVRARNYGAGALTMIVNGNVTATHYYGIYARNAGTSLSITTAAGGAVSGDTYGIHANNYGTGALSITASGDVTGRSQAGITAYNSGTGAALTINTATVSGGTDGIYASNDGTGILSITSTGTVTGTGGTGINALNLGSFSPGLTINAAASSGKFYGILAQNFSAGALSITSTGTVTGTNGAGIKATNSAAGTDMTINTAAVSGGMLGISAVNYGTGATAITANGAVTGGTNGIYANNAATAGGLNITVGGMITGTSGYGIQALNSGSGPTTITVNGGGMVQGGVAGIFVDPVAPIAIDNAGTIQNLSGASDALAIKTAGAPTTITNTGTITGVVALGDLGNSFTNGSTWNTAGGANEFGALVAGNSLTNQVGGTIIAASAGSTAAQTTSFDHVGTFTNAGLVTLQNGFAGDKAIVQGDFVGNGGTVALDTVLGADNSATDQLVLNGGQASGTTLLQIANAGGGGAQTTGDGIAVVVAQNGATSVAGAFKLSGQVAAGAYQYELFEGGNAATGGNPNDQNWYLRDTLVVTPLPPPDDTSGGTPPPPPTVPNYRDEVPVYMAMPELANTVSLALIGTYDTRMGGDRESAGTLFAPDTQPLVWGRLLGATGQQKPGDQPGLNTGNDFLNGKGPRYGYDYIGLQLGMDLLRKASSDGSHDHVGAYGGLVHAEADVDPVYDIPGAPTEAGTLDMDAYSLGLYWTHFGVSGWYSDVVMQGTWFGKVKGQTVNTAMDVQGAAFTASTEGGYPFHFSESWTVEPQGQIVFQHQSLGDGVDRYGLTSFDDVNDLRGRIGAKLSRAHLLGADDTSLTLWARANLWHDFAASNPSATFANLSGSNPVTLDGSLRGTSAQIDAGLSGHLTPSISMFGSAFYEHAIDGAQSWSAGGSGGIKSTGVKIGAEMRL